MPGSGFTLLADTVLVSSGQEADVPESWGLGTTPDGVIKTGDASATGRNGVFAAGDAVTGPDSIVEAMAQGKKVAIEIDRYLGGDGDISEGFAPEPGEEMVMPSHLAEQGKPPIVMSKAEAEHRVHSFEIVERGYSPEEAVAEARRCVRCDLWRHGAPEVWSTQPG